MTLVQLTEKREKVVLLLLSAMQFTHIVDFMILMPLGPRLMRLFSISPAQFSLLVSVYTVSAGIVGFLNSFWIDRFDRRKALVFAYVGFLIGTLGCAMASTYPALLIARSVAGIFGGIANSLILSVIGDVIPIKRRGAAMGMVMASFSVASVIGVPISLLISSHYDWHSPFLVLALLGLPIAIVSWLQIPSIHSTKSVTSEIEKDVFELFKVIQNEPVLRKAYLILFLIILGQFTVIPFISTYMVQNVGLAESDLPLVYMFGGGATFFSSQWVGKLSDKYGREKVLFRFLLASLLPLFLITNLPVIPLWAIIMLTTIFFVVLNGRMVPAMTLISAAVPGDKRAGLMSLTSCLQQLSTGFAAYLAGAIVSTGPDQKLSNFSSVGYVAIGFSLICIWKLWSTRAVSIPSANPI